MTNFGIVYLTQFLTDFSQILHSKWGVWGLGCLWGIVSAVVGCLGRLYKVAFMHDIGYVLSDCLFWDIEVNVNSSTLMKGMQHCCSVVVVLPFKQSAIRVV